MPIRPWRNPFDPIAYPANASTLISLAGIEELVKLRNVSKTYQYMAETRLAHTLTLRCHKDKNGSITFKIEVYTSDSSTIETLPGLCGWSKPFQVAADVPLSTRRMLGLARAVTVHLRKGHYSPGTDFAPAANVCASVAPHLTNIDVLRIDSVWPPTVPIPFTGKTLVLKTSLSDREGNNLMLPLPRFNGFAHLVVLVDADSGRGKEPWFSATPSPPVYPATLKSLVIIVDKHITPEDSLPNSQQLDLIVANTISAAHLVQKQSTSILSLMNAVGPSHIDYTFALKPCVALIKELLQRAGHTTETMDDAMARVEIVAPDALPARHTAAFRGKLFERTYHLQTVMDPVTERALGKLEKVFQSQASPFTAHGIIDLDDLVHDVTLYFKNCAGDAAAVHLPLDKDSATRIYEAGAIPPFGPGTELVYDDMYHSAREIKPPHMSLSSDIVAHGSVLNVIQLGLASDPLYAVMSKLNVYAEGGFFKPHSLTSRGDNYQGTLTLCLPSTFTGGELIVRHAGEEQIFDWAAAGARVIPWTFLYSDCEHEVLPVRSGMHLTLTYDVYVLPDNMGQPFAAPHSHVSLALDDFLASSLLPGGGILAFGLQHSYASAPHNADWEGEMDLLPMLKGTDKSWANAIRDTGLDFEFVAVYRGGERKTYSTRLNYRYRHFICSRTGGGMHWVTMPGAWGMTDEYIEYDDDDDESAESFAIHAYIGPPGARNSYPRKYLRI